MRWQECFCREHTSRRLVRLQCQARMKFWVPTGERIRSHHMYGIKTCTTPVCRLHWQSRNFVKNVFSGLQNMESNIKELNSKAASFIHWAIRCLWSCFPVHIMSISVRKNFSNSIQSSIRKWKQFFRRFSKAVRKMSLICIVQRGFPMRMHWESIIQEPISVCTAVLWH